MGGINRKVSVTKNGVRVYPNPDFINKMPAVQRQAWAKALLSGEYRQGDGILMQEEYDDNDKPFRSFCCLGVLLHARGVPYKDLEGVALPDTCPNDKAHRFTELFGPEGDPEIGIRAGIDEMAVCASECNDNLGLSFKQIARLIYPEAHGY